MQVADITTAIASYQERSSRPLKISKFDERHELAMALLVLRRENALRYLGGKASLWRMTSQLALRTPRGGLQ
jgi:hypothetical protein